MLRSIAQSRTLSNHRNFHTPHRGYYDNSYRGLSPKETFIRYSSEFAETCRLKPDFSKYSHKNHDHPPSYNCYGFMAHLLGSSHPLAYHEVLAWMHKMKDVISPSLDNRPCPFHYQQFFKSLPKTPASHWEPVEKPEEMQIGDIIAYTPENYHFPEKAEFSDKPTGTHVLTVKQVYGLTPSQVNLLGIDCTKAPHSKQDTRKKGGIGISPVILHFWKNQSAVQWHPKGKKNKREISIGRLK